jgi:hypothetical protein
MEVSDHFYTLAHLPSQKEPQYPFNRRLGQPQSWYEHNSEEKKSQSVHLENQMLQFLKMQ